MKQYRFAVGSAVIVAGLAFLVVSSVSQSAARHMTLPMLLEQDEADGRVQLGGCKVVEGSIQWDTYRHRSDFEVTDGERTLSVRYIGNAILPDTFQDKAVVVLEGEFIAEKNRFDAEVVFAKCPSKYEGQNYEDHVKAMGNNS
jgi:cytochrome c-type biogenesis protein CcmE